MQGEKERKRKKKNDNWKEREKKKIRGNDVTCKERIDDEEQIIKIEKMKKKKWKEREKYWKVEQFPQWGK